MNDDRHDKAWNDPPLFSLDQMSRAGQGAHNRRHRYPQQEAANHPNAVNPMSQMNAMMATSPQMFNQRMQSNQEPVGVNYGHNQPLMSANIGGFNNYGPNQGFAATNHEIENNFDVNAFVYAIQMCLTSNPNIPQELHQKWHNTQSYLHNTSLEPQTKATLQSLTAAVQSRDFNSARFYSYHLLNDSNQIVRTILLVVCEIFKYFA